MDREKIIQEAKAELERHVWGTFVEGDMSVALGGSGVVVSGCEACRKRFGTNRNGMCNHLGFTAAGRRDLR